MSTGKGAQTHAHRHRHMCTATVHRHMCTDMMHRHMCTDMGIDTCDRCADMCLDM